MNPDTKRLVTLLTAHNDVMSLFIYDPLEAKLPDAGRLTMAESELQLEVNTSGKKLRQQFANDFEKRLERMKNISRGRAIPFLPIETSHDVARQIRDQLGASIGQGRRAATGK